MKLKVDEQADALYPRLDDSKIVDSEEVSPGVILDFNEHDQVVGVEIQSLSKRVPKLNLNTISNTNNKLIFLLTSAACHGIMPSSTRGRIRASMQPKGANPALPAALSKPHIRSRARRGCRRSGPLFRHLGPGKDPVWTRFGPGLDSLGTRFGLGFSPLLRHAPAATSQTPAPYDTERQAQHIFSPVSGAQFLGNATVSGATNPGFPNLSCLWTPHRAAAIMPDSKFPAECICRG